MSPVAQPSEGDRQAVQLKFLQSFCDRCEARGLIGSNRRLMKRHQAAAFEFFMGALALDKALYGKSFLVPAGFVFGLQFEGCIYTYVLDRIAAFERKPEA